MKRASAFYLASLVWVILLSTCGQTMAAAPELITVVTNGPATDRINLVVLAEGYQQSERTKFINDSKVVINAILGADPLVQYKSFYNAYAVFVASVQSGSDHPFTSIFKNTYFNSTYDSYGTQRLITIPPNDYDGDSSHGEGKVYSILQTLVPNYDLVALVVNDSEYGGSGGAVLVVSTHAQSPEIAVHEQGHTFAHLGDEYSDAYPGFPDTEEPNTTRSNTRATVKWNKWIAATTPVPTPDSFTSSVGLFLGAHYHATGWYRPKFNCKMRALGVPFCEVCAEALVLSIYSLVNPFSKLTPDNASTTLVPYGKSGTFHIDTVSGKKDSVNVAWKLNGVTLATADPHEISIPSDALTLKTNSLIATLQIVSPYVRNDPTDVLASNVEWKVVLDPNSPLPLSAVPQSNGKVMLTWPAAVSGFVLERSSNVLPTLWQPVAGTPTKVGGEYQLLVSPSGSHAYFRLHKP